MDVRAYEVLRLFTDLLHASAVPVTQSLPERGFVEIEYQGRPARLRFDERELLKLLQGAPRARHQLGESLPAPEAAAKLLAVYLDGSLASQQPDVSGWWQFTGGHFEPTAPAELAPLSTDTPAHRWPLGLSVVWLIVALANGIGAALDQSLVSGAIAGAMLIFALAILWLALGERRRG